MHFPGCGPPSFATVTAEQDVSRAIGLLRGHSAAEEAVPDEEWSGCLAVAARHGVSPLIYRRLQDSGVMPRGEHGAALREHYLSSAAANTLLLRELGAVLRALRSAGVPAIPLKGACLAEPIYRDIALRPMADLDLLVRPADMPGAMRVLQALGYAPDQPFDPAAQPTDFQDMPTMSREGCAPIELHWTLVTPLCNATLDADELDGIWSRAVPTVIAGEPALVCAPEDLLLHLCMHASVHHRFYGITLRHFVDIAKVCRHYAAALDWKAFTERANRWGVSNGVRMALALTAEWTECAAPDGVYAELGGGFPEGDILEWVRHKVLAGGPEELNSDIARLGTRVGVAGRFVTLLEAALPPRAVMTRLYPARADSWRILAYYPVRWKGLWVRYRGALWKLVTRDRAFAEDARKEARLREYLGWT